MKEKETPETSPIYQNFVISLQSPRGIDSYEDCLKEFSNLGFNTNRENFRIHFKNLNYSGLSQKIQTKTDYVIVTPIEASLVGKEEYYIRYSNIEYAAEEKGLCFCSSEDLLRFCLSYNPSRSEKLHIPINNGWRTLFTFGGTVREDRDCENGWQHLPFLADKKLVLRRIF